MSKILISILFILFAINVKAQIPADSTLEREGLARLAALLNLNLNDIKFRDDYTEQDQFRLTTVAELMNNPYGMVAYNESLRDAASGINLESILSFLFENLKVENQPDRRILAIPEEDFGFEGISLYYNSIEFNRLLMMANLYLYYIIPEAVDSTFALLSPENKKFLLNEFKELLVEDTADEYKPVDILDSIQQAEEEYVAQFVEFGQNIRKDFLLKAGIEAARLIFDEVNLLISEIKTGNISYNKILSDTTAIPSRVGIARYLGKHKKWKIGGVGNNYYSGDYDLIIDFGGDDRYDLAYDPGNPHAVIVIDISGNDIYNSLTDYTIGAGCMNVGLLFDMAGDDIYNGQSFSVGSGYFGFGMIYDESGSDKYYGDTHVQGAGTFGIGTIIDKDGNDNYNAALYGQGFGMTEGFGVIIEGGGNDNYFAGSLYKETLGLAGDNLHYLSLSQGFAYGMRPYTSGGIGAIVDFKGKDNYISDIYGQGSSYWWSLGLIYDSSGNDQYVSYQYAQGAGIHMSLGFLMDENGDDFYRGKGLMQGCGHDYGCGFILDRNGNDIYQSEGLSQAGGQANGIGILIDNRGNDAYYVLLTENTQGYGNPRRDFGSIGLFLDMSGIDIYSGNGSDNALWITDSKWGGGMDWELIIPDSIEAANEADK